MVRKTNLTFSLVRSDFIFKPVVGWSWGPPLDLEMLTLKCMFVWNNFLSKCYLIFSYVSWNTNATIRGTLLSMNCFFFLKSKGFLWDWVCYNTTNNYKKIIYILGESKKMSVSNKGAFLTNGHFFWLNPVVWEPVSIIKQHYDRIQHLAALPELRSYTRTCKFVSYLPRK